MIEFAFSPEEYIQANPQVKGRLPKSTKAETFP
jgi:hypothetical protein